MRIADERTPRVRSTTRRTALDRSHDRRELLAIALRCLPLLLLFGVPFHLPLERIQPELARYGLLDRYLVLAGVAGSALLWLDAYARAERRAAHWDAAILGGLLGVAALALRVCFYDFASEDYKGALAIWFSHLERGGGFAALKDVRFSDYNVVYLYIMAALTYLPFEKLHALKSVSVLFDFAAAVAVFRIAQLMRPGNLARSVLLAGALLFLPTVVLNGSLWGQCDSIWACFLLWSLVALIAPTPRPRVALVFFACALSFKLQSIFFALPLALHYLNRRFRLVDLWIVPAVLAVASLPAVLLGRPPLDFVAVYGRQVLKYPQLTREAPSIFALLPGAPFAEFSLAGVVWSLTVVVVLAALFLRTRARSDAPTTITAAFASVLLLPFLLPKMHERYFFAADVLSLVYLLVRPDRWWVALLVNLASLWSYFPFLFHTTVVDPRILALMMATAAGTMCFDLARQLGFRLPALRSP